MQACWVSEIAERPTAKHVAEALELAKSYAETEQTQEEIAALEAETNPGRLADSSDDRLNGNAAMPYDDFLEMVGLQDKKAELAEYLTEGAELDQLKQMDEEELDEDILDDLGLDEETKTKFHAELRTLQQSPAADGLSSGGSTEANSSNDSLKGNAAMPYDDFLEMVGLQDKKAELAEYLTEGAELDQLKQLDEEELDEDILDDLGLDEETKNAFHEKLQALKNAQADDKQQVSQVGLDVVDAAARAAAAQEAQWPKWPTLQKMLPELRGLQDKAQTLEEALAAKDQELVAKEEELAAAVADKERHREELVAKDEELVAKDEELAAAVADKERHREELEQLRAQLARLEGVPP
eukprot:COSAG03_NODE_2456_length_2737_cov_23.434799_3_plen_354_part_00